LDIRQRGIKFRLRMGSIPSTRPRYMRIFFRTTSEQNMEKKKKKKKPAGRQTPPIVRNGLTSAEFRSFGPGTRSVLCDRGKPEPSTRLIFHITVIIPIRNDGV
jgi:hypothetical protein